MKKIFVNILMFFSIVLLSGQTTNVLYYNAKNREKIFFITDQTNTKAFVYYYSPDDTLKYKYFLDGVPAPPDIYFQDDNYFILLQVGGSNYFYWDVFSKNKIQQNSFFNPLAIDKKNRIIAYQPAERQVAIATFDNQIIAKKNLNIKFSYLDYYIDTAFIWENAFYVRWNKNVADKYDGLQHYKHGQYSLIIKF